MNLSGGMEIKMIEKAKEICIKAHEGQVDKSGQPYYLHPFAVAEMVDTDIEKQVAYLHDVIEDTNITIEDLKAEGFDIEVLSALEAITKRPDESYDEYIQRVKQNKIASVVKIKDMMHNSNITRYEDPTVKEIEKSILYLERLKDLYNQLQKK